MSRFATGVTVMTCVHRDEPHGMTANAVASVSLEPPLVLVCVGRDNEMARLVEETGAFALSILPGDREDLSAHFANGDRPDGGAQFSDVATEVAVTGSPVLGDAIGWFDCQVWKLYDGGDHVIVVGEVVACGTGPDRPALAFYRSGYTSLPSS